MSFVGYMWKDTDGSILLLPPVSQGAFRRWLDRRDATKRKWVDTPDAAGEVKGYWRIDASEESALIVTLNKLALSEGWMIVDQRPSHLLDGESEESSNDSAYDVLHLKPDAPREVVDAAYKALQRLHHPDRGGCLETSQRINEAHGVIYKQRGW